MPSPAANRPVAARPDGEPIVPIARNKRARFDYHILDSWEASGERPKSYNAGTWGPAASSALLSRDGMCWTEEE